MDNRPIGVFDSGFGGISVLAAAVSLLPNERFIYLGDNLHAPYGGLPEEDILAHTRAGVRFLTEQNCKAIVIACNTATSVAAAALRREMALPIVAMEPALKPAALLAGDGRVLVLATEVTLKLDKFKQLMQLYGRDAVPIACPGFVPLVEAGITEGEQINALIEEYLSPYLKQPVKAVVLGCTHYVFLKRALKQALPKHVPLIDGNGGTARQLQKRLAQHGLESGAGAEKPDHRIVFHSTKTDAETMARMRMMYDLARDQLRDK